MAEEVEPQGEPADEEDDDQRSSGIAVDLEALEEQAETLYLHRFIEAVKKARNEHGRYLILRAGDEMAIRSAGDGSSESLDAVIVESPE